MDIRGRESGKTSPAAIQYDTLLVLAFRSEVICVRTDMLGLTLDSSFNTRHVPDLTMYIHSFLLLSRHMTTPRLQGTERLCASVYMGSSSCSTSRKHVWNMRFKIRVRSESSRFGWISNFKIQIMHSFISVLIALNEKRSEPIR